MVRKILFHLIPFLLPFIAYGLYLFATRRARAKGAAFDEAPWSWLFSAGLALTGASLIAVRRRTGNMSRRIWKTARSCRASSI